MIAAIALPARDRATWNLFTDWCAAHDHQHLPASPEVLARFLGANPASRATQRRRVSAVNAAHRAAGAPPPGRSEEVRRLVDASRDERMQQRLRAVASAVAAFPAAGWPTLLFARRDAMLLVLAAAGLRYADIARLRVEDVTSAEDGAHVLATAGGVRFQTPEMLPELGVHPSQVLARWMRIRALQDRAPSTRVIAAYLRGEGAPRVRAARADLPLVTPLDRWGACPLQPAPLTAAAVAAIVSDHLSGAPALHRAIAKTEVREPDLAPGSSPAAEPRAVVLDDGVFARGIAARRRAEESLADVSDVLDGVADRADRLMRDLLHLLDDA